uniref:Uncharacterized protein n=1 Tax=Anguilla anguilla TaxID=7936 RepID=A0A0E9U9J4_ANGAN
MKWSTQDTTLILPNSAQ